MNIDEQAAAYNSEQARKRQYRKVSDLAAKWVFDPTPDPRKLVLDCHNLLPSTPEDCLQDQIPQYLEPIDRIGFWDSVGLFPRPGNKFIEPEDIYIFTVAAQAAWKASKGAQR